MAPIHYVRPDGADPVDPVRWWGRWRRRVSDFFFNKSPGFLPPYEGKMQGSSPSDPRFHVPGSLDAVLEGDPPADPTP